jgi:hypothetical protein
MAEEAKKKVPNLSKLKAEKEAPRVFVESDEWYKAELEKAESRAGNFGPYIQFTFRLLTGVKEGSQESAKGTRISRIMDATLAPNKPLWDWATVMLGKELKVDDNFNLTAYLGEKFRVLVSDKQQKKGSDGKRYQEVRKIKRIVKEKAE